MYKERYVNFGMSLNLVAHLIHLLVNILIKYECYNIVPSFFLNIYGKLFYYTGLQQAGIPFVGSDSGISSIKGTVTGDAAVEVISDSEMRAYGWCFSIDGVEPDAMPDQVPVPGDGSEIRWYFGFAHYRDGAWVSYCTPTRQARPAYICRDL